jgi:type VI secretion system protein VasD
MNFRLLVPALFLALVCLAGCGGARLDLKVAAQPNLNPDVSERPSPVMVKVFELRNDLAFKQADFHSLFDRPMQALGADLLAADELVFVPGEARTVSYKPGKDARFLGVAAGFRQTDRARWRYIAPMDPEEDKVVALEFNDASIIPVSEDDAEDWEPEEAVRDFQKGLKRAESEGQAAAEGVRDARRQATKAVKTARSLSSGVPPRVDNPSANEDMAEKAGSAATRMMETAK